MPTQGMADGGDRARDTVDEKDGVMTIADETARVTADTPDLDTRKRSRDDPASPNDAPASKRGRDDEPESDSSMGATSPSSVPNEKLLSDIHPLEQGPEPGPRTHVLSTLLKGVKTGEDNLEADRAKTRDAITMAPAKIGGMALTAIGAIQQAKPSWHTPHTELESYNRFFPPREPDWVQELSKKIGDVDDGVAYWEDNSGRRRSVEKYHVQRFRSQFATLSLAAATEMYNPVTFQLRQIPPGLDAGQSGKPLDLLDRLRFWAARTGRGLRRVNCKRFRFELLARATLPSLQGELKTKPGGFSRWSDSLASPGGPQGSSSATASSPAPGPVTEKWYGKPTTMVPMPNKVMRDLQAADAGVLRVYRGEIPDLKNRLHKWLWFEIRRPLVKNRPDLAKMPPTMEPMPGGMLVFAVPQDYVIVNKGRSGKLQIKLSRHGIPSIEFTHSDDLRKKVTGLPPNFLCVSKYDQSELKGGSEDFDIYGAEEAKTDDGDSDGQGVWDAWYRWLCQECTKDGLVWREIFACMAESRIELTVETMDNEPWMSFEGGEWKKTSVIAARTNPVAATGGPSAGLSLEPQLRPPPVPPSVPSTGVQGIAPRIPLEIPPDNSPAGIPGIPSGDPLSIPSTGIPAFPLAIPQPLRLAGRGQPTARGSSSGRGRNVSNPKQQRGSHLRNEVKPEDDNGRS